MTDRRARLGDVRPMPRGKAVAVAALAAAVVAVGVVAESDGTAWPQPPLALGLAIGVAAGAVTTWRDRAVPVAAAVVVLCVAYHLLGFPGLAPAVALYPVLYTMAATGGGLRSIAVAVAVIAVVVPIPLMPPQAVAPGWANVGFGASLVAVVAFGEATRARRQAAAEQLRAVRLAGEQETRRQIAEDRVAVAREVHDVLAHTITAISVQAAAAGEALDDRPEDARAALAAVRGATREAMAELRSTLGTLRSEPPQGIDQLPQLQAQAQAAGLRRHADGDRQPGGSRARRAGGVPDRAGSADQHGSARRGVPRHGDRRDRAGRRGRRGHRRRPRRPTHRRARPLRHA